MSIFTLKHFIAVLWRSHTTVQHQAIALTYYFEAARSQRPGGGHDVGFFMCAACVVCPVVHEVTVG